MNVLGELAALGTSLMFSATSTQFTLAGRKVGGWALNRTRLVLAVLFLLLAHWVTRTPLPLSAGIQRWFWLALSGVIGLVIGDAFLFQAFIWIGPRLAMLMMSLAPIIATLLARIFLAETLSFWQVVAIVVTLSGIAWVVLEGNNRRGQPIQKESNYRRGILYSLGAATGQATGLVTAKLGLGGNFPALSGTLIRMFAAMLAIWILAIFSRQALQTLQTLTANKSVLALIFGGAFTGPFLGVTLSLYAVQQTEVGIASTLMALPPVFLLPIGHFIFHEHISWQAILGTLIAIAGVAMLFLV